MPPNVEVYGLQLPGRADRLAERPFTSVRELVPEISGSMTEVFGQAICFIWAQHGRDPCLRGGSLVATRYGKGARSPICLRPGAKIAEPALSIFQMNNRDFLAKVVELNGTPREVLDTPDLLSIVLPLLRADFKLVETYQFGACERLPCPITAIGGSEDEETQNGALEAWQAQTDSTFAMHVLAGDHFFIHSQEQALCRILHDTLAREDSA